MKHRMLGDVLEVSAVGLGCMGFTHAYGLPSERKDAIKAIHAAVDAGYSFFDTAECYIGENAEGITEHNENLVGEALKLYRSKVKIATKFGVRHEGRQLVLDSDPNKIRSSLETSLKRLQTDHVDLYYQHRIDPKVEPEEVAGVMKDLIQEGEILHWGISEATEDYLRRAHAVCPVTCIQNRLSMMARWHEELFPVLEELNVGFVAFSPLANGLLSDSYKKGEKFQASDYRSVMPQYQDDQFDENAELLALIREFAADHDATPAQISLAWMICKKPYIVPIPGSRRAERILENGKAADIVLSEDEVSAIDERLGKMKMSEVFGGSAVKTE